MYIANNSSIFIDRREPTRMESFKAALKNSNTAKLWTNYTNIAKTELTRLKAVNLVAKFILLTAAVAPFALATVATVASDITYMTAKGISNAFGAIRNRFAKKVPSRMARIKENIIVFAKNHKKAIIAGSALAIAGGLYFAAPAEQINKAKALAGRFSDYLKGLVATPTPAPRNSINKTLAEQFGDVFKCHAVKMRIDRPSISRDSIDLI